MRVRHKQRSMQDEIKSYLELYCVIVVLLIVARYYVVISGLLKDGVWLTSGRWGIGNLELYRVVVMLLIVAHHYVVNSGLLEVMSIFWEQAHLESC